MYLVPTGAVNKFNKKKFCTRGPKVMEAVYIFLISFNRFSRKTPTQLILVYMEEQTTWGIYRSVRVVQRTALPISANALIVDNFPTWYHLPRKLLAIFCCGNIVS